MIVSESPFGPKRRTVNRVRWSNDERTAALSSFHTIMEKNKLPSFREINEAKVKHPILKNRTNAQIKTWVYNYLKATKSRC